MNKTTNLDIKKKTTLKQPNGLTVFCVCRSRLLSLLILSLLLVGSEPTPTVHPAEFRDTALNPFTNYSILSTLLDPHDAQTSKKKQQQQTNRLVRFSCYLNKTNHLIGRSTDTALFSLHISFKRSLIPLQVGFCPICSKETLWKLIHVCAFKKYYSGVHFKSIKTMCWLDIVRSHFALKFFFLSFRFLRGC